MENKVVSFGELLLRLSTEQHLRFAQANVFNANYGGGEFNVAVSLSNYGISTEFVSRVPDNEIGHCAVREVKKMGVGYKNIAYGGERLGIYFLETGAGIRGSNVVYDRAYSSMSAIIPGIINWEIALSGANWFHWSGITPALSASASEACLEAVQTAKRLGLTVSCDLNYRSKLWQYGKQPHEVMPELLKHTDVVLGDIDTAYSMLGFQKVNPDYQERETLAAYYAMLFEQCPNLKIAATTLRYSVSATHQRIGGVLYNGTDLYTSDVREITPVVDRVGSGDAFMGGLLYGLLQYGTDYKRTIDFAVAACCLKHTVYGDYNEVTLKEVNNIMSGLSAGLVSR